MIQGNPKKLWGLWLEEFSPIQTVIELEPVPELAAPESGSDSFNEGGKGYLGWVGESIDKSNQWKPIQKKNE